MNSVDANTMVVLYSQNVELQHKLLLSSTPTYNKQHKTSNIQQATHNAITTILI